MRTDSSGTGGNWLTIEDEDGWQYEYGHINNDSPGTDDGANPARWRFAEGLEIGSEVRRGEFVAYMGDSGNAEATPPHLHFEIRRPDGAAINPKQSLDAATHYQDPNARCRPNAVPRTPSPTSGAGYWAMARGGQVFPYGAARTHEASADRRPPNGALGLVATRRGEGYYKFNGDGGVYPYGDARDYGTLKGTELPAPIANMTLAPSGRGYWLVGRDGAVYNLGAARHYGVPDPATVTSPIIALLPTHNGQGYWLVAADGTTYRFGNAADLGAPTAATVVSAASTPTRRGYWLLTKRGKVLTFGDAQSFAGLRKLGFCRTLYGKRIAASRSGNGYWIVEHGGRIFAFGDARPLGDPTGDDKVTRSMDVMPAGPEVASPTLGVEREDPLDAAINDLAG
jgi:hypothetical protein